MWAFFFYCSGVLVRPYNLETHLFSSREFSNCPFHFLLYVFVEKIVIRFRTPELILFVLHFSFFSLIFHHLICVYILLYKICIYVYKYMFIYVYIHKWDGETNIYYFHSDLDINI